MSRNEKVRKGKACLWAMGKLIWVAGRVLVDEE